MLFATVALAAALAAGPLDGRTVVLDPGHNGRNGAHPERVDRQVHVGGGMYKACNTTGTATASGYPESRFNLAVAREAARILRRRGATVALTRRNDRGVGPCVTRRARIANRARADAAVSIHADGGPPGGRGFHVIVPGELQGYTDDVQASSAKLGTALRDAMRETGMPDSTYLGSNGLDVRTNLVGLVLSDTPKVFLESGNMRNAADAALLSSPAFRQRIAEALADAVVQWRRGS